MLGDVVDGILPRQHLRISRNAQHPHAALRVERHRYRPLKQWLGREELNVEAFRKLQKLALDFGIVAVGVIVGEFLMVVGYV